MQSRFSSKCRSLVELHLLVAVFDLEDGSRLFSLKEGFVSNAGRALLFYYISQSPILTNFFDFPTKNMAVFIRLKGSKLCKHTFPFTILSKID